MRHLKTVFARFGIPYTLVTDNGPQFISQEMKEFASSYDFQHTTTTPYYPQANGLAKRMVKTVKKLLEHSADPHKALLSYRTTPLPWCGLSPAELLMGRKIRMGVPQLTSYFVPSGNISVTLNTRIQNTGKHRKRTMINTMESKLFHHFQRTPLYGLTTKDIKFLDDYYKELGHPNPTLLKYPRENFEEIEHTSGFAWIIRELQKIPAQTNNIQQHPPPHGLSLALRLEPSFILLIVYNMYRPKT